MEDNLELFCRIFGDGNGQIKDIIRLAEETVDGQAIISEAGTYLIQNVNKEKVYSLFESALALAQDSCSRNNVRMMRMVFRYSELQVKCIPDENGKKKIFFLAYLNMAFLTVIATWLTLARQTAANPTAGTNYEMDAISACVVGGVSAYGGSGSVLGMVVGATLIGVINLGMSLMGIDANWQKVVKGVVLLAAVVFEIMNNKPKTKA